MNHSSFVTHGRDVGDRRRRAYKAEVTKMSWLTIRPRPVLLTAFRSGAGLSSAAAFGMSAPEARQTHSLGREPQGTGYHNTRKPPKGGDRLRLRRQLQPPSSVCLSPLRGLRIFFHAVYLGLTPQAMDLTPLRGWAFAILATRGGENHSSWVESFSRVRAWCDKEGRERNTVADEQGF